MTMLNFGGIAKSLLSAIEHGDVQPNAVDVRLKSVFRITTQDFILTEERKQHRGAIPVEPNSEGLFVLDPGSYEVIMENEIEVAHGEAGFVITRSTLNRNGVFLTSGLYDSGYKGVMAGVMHVTSGRAIIGKGTRVGQMLLFKAETLHLYDGSYGHGKEHDKKYT